MARRKVILRPKPTRPEDRVIPKQNKALVATICSCQLIAVLSVVSFIYLSVAIYIPSMRAFKAGFDATPVTCQTVETVMINNCSWASCGEWCLTKTTGFCPQIHVSVRNNGTDILLEKCSRMSRSSCPPARPETLHRYNCNNGTECNTLTGLFNCSLGHCSNMSEIFLCDYKTETYFIDSEKDNTLLNGFFECKRSRCAKIKKAITCDRYCQKITTSGMNLYVTYDDDLYSAECSRVVTAGPNRTEIWTKNKTKKVLLVSCTKVVKIDNFTLRGTDCINGTLIPDENIPKPYINHTVFWQIYEKGTELVDPEDKLIPSQRSLTIYNTTRLLINLEGCVNTLKGECKEFLATHGRDGRNRSAYSRFPCYFNRANPVKAIARYDLEKTRRELIIALIVPIVLFVISFTTLIGITRSVRVDDDTVLRCQLCLSDPLEDPKPLRESNGRELKELTDREYEGDNNDDDFDETKMAAKKRYNGSESIDNNGGTMVL